MKEKQIAEMAELICERMPYSICELNECRKCPTKEIAKRLYNADYRKQGEGEWELHKGGGGTCSECHFTQKNVWDYDNWQNFCGHCGVRMKGVKIRDKENEYT